MGWTLVSEGLPVGRKPTYPPPFCNRYYDKYLVTNGCGDVFFAFYVERYGEWMFVNPFNHNEIKDVYAWIDGNLAPTKLTEATE
jgi:hypothetical protein